MDKAHAESRLKEHGQEHVLRFWDRLDDGARAALLKQIESLDLRSVERMGRQLLDGNGDAAPPEDIRPASVEVLEGSERAEAAAAGERCLRAGEAGVILVAGGQGSRLGFEGPKGAFPIGPITQAPLFAVHSRKILGLERKFGAPLPFYIMTSEANDGPTRDFFAEHDYFGLTPGRVHFFVQGMWPALTPEGKIVLDRPDHIFMGPDGHGGTLSALRDNGMLEDMEKRGLRHLFYFQVDNPLVEIADPAFMGLHAMREADISVKVCAKRDPNEGLGVVVERGGRNALVEYTELTDAQKQAVEPDGELRFKYGSVAIHVFAYPFLKTQASADLPLHVAHKKVPTCGDDGSTVTPEKPNAYKFEKFIFDAIPNAERVLNLAFAREEEFSPVKNAEGQDSPATAKRDMVRKYARRLEACGAEIARDADGEPAVAIEIDPVHAVDDETLKARFGEPRKVTEDLLLD